ncbi:MAG TPA: ORF6N domain-containing protein [Kofleriaceae bacterium]
MTRINVTPHQKIGRSIHFVRDQQVLLDEDLAELYEVPVKALNQATRRNPERFPSDFMFQLTKQEFANLKSLVVTSRSHGGRRYLPFAFTEEGIAMLSSVLRSPRAARVNVEIMRAFVRMRVLIASNDELRRKLDELEKKYDKHDQQFAGVFAAIRALMKAGDHKPTLGFARDKDDEKDKRG